MQMHLAQPARQVLEKCSGAPVHCYAASAEAENCTVHFIFFAQQRRQRAAQVHMNITAHIAAHAAAHMKSLTAMFSNSHTHTAHSRAREDSGCCITACALCVSFFPTAFVQMCIYIHIESGGGGAHVCVPLCGTTAGGKDREEQQQLICILCDCVSVCMYIISARTTHSIRYICI